MDGAELNCATLRSATLAGGEADDVLDEWASFLELNLPQNVAMEWGVLGRNLMKKILITTAVLFTALPFTFDGVAPTVSKAHAIIGRPLTPFSVAGVHRRAVRRTFGVGANLGYRGFYHRNFGPYAYHRFHPVARAAAVGVAPGWGGGWGWGGWGWRRW
jgi:hypothetical protein